MNMMIVNRFLLRLPLTPAENTIAWFWSGINVTTYNSYVFIKYMNFYENQMRNKWNQSS